MHTFTLKPLVTEKSLTQAANGVYNFVVPTHATKQGIKMQVETAFGVKVRDVRTATTSRVAVTFRRRAGTKSAWKKAMVTLQSGQTISEFSLPVESEQPTAPTESVKPVTEKTTSAVTVRSRSKTKKQGVANG